MKQNHFLKMFADRR